DAAHPRPDRPDAGSEAPTASTCDPTAEARRGSHPRRSGPAAGPERSLWHPRCCRRHRSLGFDGWLETWIVGPVAVSRPVAMRLRPLRRRGWEGSPPPILGAQGPGPAGHSRLVLWPGWALCDAADD